MFATSDSLPLDALGKLDSGGYGGGACSMWHPPALQHSLFDCESFQLLTGEQQLNSGLMSILCSRGHLAC